MERNVKVFVKAYCRWNHGVLTTLEKFGLKFVIIDVTNNSQSYNEMVSKTGQFSTPCVEINGEMLIDVGGSEVENWLISNGFQPITN